MTVMVAAGKTASLPAPSVAIPRSALSSRGGFVRFTVDDVQIMLAQGVLPEDSTTELLNGLVVHKDRSDVGGEPLTHGPKHRSCIRRLIAQVQKIDTTARHAQVQLPIVCGVDQMPEPDFAVIRGTDADYASRLPSANDTLMVLEASDSSLERDRDEKLAIYAAAGIEQYVILDLRSETALVSSQPDRVVGTYLNTETLSKDGAIAIRVGDGEYVSIPLVDLLP
jgi:hypothetical protein